MGPLRTFVPAHASMHDRTRTSMEQPDLSIIHETLCFNLRPRTLLGGPCTYGVARDSVNRFSYIAALYILKQLHIFPHFPHISRRKYRFLASRPKNTFHRGLKRVRCTDEIRHVPRKCTSVGNIRPHAIVASWKASCSSENTPNPSEERVSRL